MLPFHTIKSEFSLDSGRQAPHGCQGRQHIKSVQQAAFRGGLCDDRVPAVHICELCLQLAPGLPD